MDSLTLKRHNSFQDENNSKPTHNFAPRPLTFKFQQEALKFSDICENWSKFGGKYFKPRKSKF